MQTFKEAHGLRSIGLQMDPRLFQRSVQYFDLFKRIASLSSSTDGVALLNRFTLASYERFMASATSRVPTSPSSFWSVVTWNLGFRSKASRRVRFVVTSSVP